VPGPGHGGGLATVDGARQCLPSTRIPYDGHASSTSVPHTDSVAGSDTNSTADSKATVSDIPVGMLRHYVDRRHDNTKHTLAASESIVSEREWLPSKRGRNGDGGQHVDDGGGGGGRCQRHQSGRSWAEAPQRPLQKTRSVPCGSRQNGLKIGIDARNGPVRRRRTGRPLDT
jgi:hypothetical protein